MLGMHALFDNSLALCALVDAQSKVEKVNRVWREFFSSVPTHDGNAFFDYFTSNSRPQLQSALNSLRTSKKDYLDCAVQTSHRGDRLTLRLHFMSHEGLYLVTGMPSKAHAQVRSASSLKREMFAQMLDRVPCLAAITEGDDFVYTYANDYYLQFMGGRDIIGKSIQESVPDLSPEIFAILEDVYRSGKRFEGLNMPLVGDWHGNGTHTKKYFTFIYAPLFDNDNEIKGVWSLAIDVTESKQLEDVVDLSQKVAGLGQIAAGMAHEINNPLSYILGGIKILEAKLAKDEPICPEEAKDLVKKCEKGVYRIRDIVSSLKSLSNNTMKRETTTFSLAEALQSALEYVQEDVKGKAHISYDLCPSIAVEANRSDITQVFWHLIMNAMHSFSSKNQHEKTNTIEIIAQVQECKSLVRIVVRDNGEGIPGENLDKVFDPFFTSKNPSSSSGLGLSLCLRIIEGIQGSLRIESEVGLGTSCIITIPILESSHLAD